MGELEVRTLPVGDETHYLVKVSESPTSVSWLNLATGQYESEVPGEEEESGEEPEVVEGETGEIGEEQTEEAMDEDEGDESAEKSEEKS